MFNPDNTLGDIKHQLGQVAATQIQGVGRVYEQEPDNPPENGAVIVAMRNFKILSDTNGKLNLKVVFGIHYCVRRTRSIQDMPEVEEYLMPFLMAYTSWANQQLNNDFYLMTVTDGGVVQQPICGVVYRCLVTNVEIVTEYNIPLS